MSEVIKNLDATLSRLEQTMLSILGALDKRAFRKANKLLEEQLDKTQKLNKVKEEQLKIEEKRKKIAEFYAKKDTEEVKKVEGLTRRTQILNKTLTKLAEEQGLAKKENVKFGLSLENMNKYVEQGGTKLEFLALFMTSASEQMQILGFEASSVRRVIYGFLPRGAFRLVNQLATTFNGLGSVFRGVSEDGEKTSSVLGKLVNISKKTLGFKFVDKKKKKEEDGSTDDAFGGLFSMSTKQTKQAIKNMKKAEKISRKEKLKSQKLEAKNAKFRLKQRIKEENAARDKVNEYRTAAERAFVKQSGQFGALGDTRTLEEYRQQQEEFVEKMLSDVRAQPGSQLAERESALRKASGRVKDQKKQHEQAAKALEDTQKNSPFRKRAQKIQKFTTSMLGTVRQVLMSAGKFMFMGLFVIMGIIVILKTIGPTIFKAIKAAIDFAKPAFDFIFEAFGTIWEGLTEIFDGIFGDGGLDKALSGIIKVAFGILKVIVGILYAVVMLSIGFIGNFIGGLWSAFTGWLVAFMSKGNKIARAAVLAVTIAAGIIAAIMGAPVLIIAGVMGVVFAAAKFLMKKLEKIPGFSTGGVSSGGMALVGEKGPEFVSLPAGSRIHNNRESKNMARKGTVNNYNTFNINVNPKDLSDQEMKKVIDRISKEMRVGLGRRTSL